jgi:hypothetical protein
MHLSTITTAYWASEPDAARCVLRRRVLLNVVDRQGARQFKSFQNASMPQVNDSTIGATAAIDMPENVTANAGD